MTDARILLTAVNKDDAQQVELDFMFDRSLELMRERRSVAGVWKVCFASGSKTKELSKGS